MRKNKLIVCIIGIILITSMLFACGSKNPTSLSGRYVEDGGCTFSYIEFFPDGKYSSSHPNYEGDYSISGNRIRLEGILVDSKIYYFKVSGNKLELSYNEDMSASQVYTKE